MRGLTTQQGEDWNIRIFWEGGERPRVDMLHLTLGGGVVFSKGVNHGDGKQEDEGQV